MNPYRLKNVFQYLTSNNQLLKKKLKLGTSEIPIPPKRQDVIDVEVINRFSKANPRVETTNLQPLSVKQSNVKKPNEAGVQGVVSQPVRTYDPEKDSSKKISNVLGAYKRYRRGEKNPELNFNQFFELYSTENFAEGGRAGYEDGGMLVQPSDDGSRPGYKGIKDYSPEIQKIVNNYGIEKYNKLSTQNKFRVRDGQDVGSLSSDKLKKNVFKKEYDKATKFYKDKGLQIDKAATENIRKNIRINNGKFVAPTKKLKAESGLTGLFKNYSEQQLVKDLKVGKGPYEIAIEYFNNNETEVLELLEGKKGYTKPLGRLSNDLLLKIKQNKEATKFYNKIKKENSFNKPTSSSKYIKDLETLLPYAQEKGLIPKVNAKGMPINTASKYFNYAYKIKADPIAKLFNYAEKVGIEHPRGVARAVIFNDFGTLNDIVATLPESNVSKGSSFDKFATGQATSFKNTGNSKYIKSINKITNQAFKEFGTPRSIYDIKSGVVTARDTGFSLSNPNIQKDAKSFIEQYIAKDGSKRPSFKKLDKTLQESILAYEKGNKIEGNKKLKISIMKKVMAFCPAGTAKVTKAGGGRVPYADGPVCTPQEAARGLNEEIDKIKKGNASAGEKSRTLNKLKNLGSVGMRGLVKAGLVSEVLLEAALGFDRVVSEGQSPMQAFRQSYLTAPLRGMGVMKSFEEGEREELLNVASDKGKVGRVLDLQDTVLNRDKLINKINNLETSLDDQQALDDGSGFAGSTEPLQKNIADLKAQLQDSYRDGQVNRAEELFSTKPQDLKTKDQSLMDAYNNAIEKRAVGQASNSFKAQSAAADENRIRKANKAMIDLGGTYQDYKNPFTKDEYENFARQEGYLPSDKAYTDKYFTEAILNPMKFEQLMETPGFKGASDKFASGGLASLTDTIPPESGPTPQGLPYVYNSVKKI